MPNGVEHLSTWIKDVAVIEYDQLTEEEIRIDTETVDGKFYQLPKMRLIWIKLWSDTIDGGKEWGTMRPYNPEKFQYYKSLIGQQVGIIIK